MQTTITSKGQTTIPKSVRDALHLRAGDKIIFEEQGDGSYLIRARSQDVQALKELVNYSGSVKALEDMQKAIYENASEF